MGQSHSSDTNNATTASKPRASSKREKGSSSSSSTDTTKSSSPLKNNTSAISEEKASSSKMSEAELTAQIATQGAVVKELKLSGKGNDDPEVASAVLELKALKSALAELTGVEQTGGRESKKKAPKPEKAKKESTNKEMKKETKLGMHVGINEDFGAWYSQVVVEAELIDYYDISGCYILRPYAFTQWEFIQQFFNQEIKKLGVENAYFPMFVSQSRLEAEKDHIEDFSPEVAWVTKSGDSDLECPIAVRPTSETVMYPHYANWIRSHRDLPLLLNQWCNVVRWEFKHPTPFIRSREFLWQEGHTAHATKKACDEEVRTILDLYRQVYEDMLAVPVIPGVKSEKEKFAGGLYTTTVEAFVPYTGRGIQGATSHCLGQNFAKMFDITFENDKGGRSMVWQNSWGMTTRMLGVCYMVHGDDVGLRLPPKIAPIQVVIVTIPNSKLSEEKAQMLKDKAEAIGKSLTDDASVRVKTDTRDNYTPGWKYSHWEVKGVPIRLEFGPRDLDNETCVLVRRDTREKEVCKLADVNARVQELLVEIQQNMFNQAKAIRDTSTITVTEWKDFVPALDQKKMVLTPWCETKESEEEVKKRSSEESEGGAAKTLCIPFIQPPLKEGTKCFITGKPATVWVLWGRSY
jgi:prolyl-tRNA synthetase